MTRGQYRFEKAASGVLSLVFLFFTAAWMLLPVLIWAGQLFTWLQDGQWPRYTGLIALQSFGLDAPQVSWIGVQRIIDWVLSLPAALLILIFGWPVAHVLLDLHNNSKDFVEAYERQESDRVRDEQRRTG